MVRVTIEIDERDADELARAFDGGDPAALATQLVELAAGEYLDWILGRTRHRSLTEEHLARVEQIYETMLTAEPPSFDRLYNSFNMPHGQAAYLARALNDKTVKRWRIEARRDLKSDLERERLKADQRIAAGDGDKVIQVLTTRLPAIELTRLCDAEIKLNRSFVGATIKNPNGNQRTVELPATSFIAVLERLTEELAHA